MGACVGSACDPSEAHEDNRFLRFINDRDDRLYLFLLLRCDHGICVGGDGTRKVPPQIAVVGLDIHHESVVLVQPLAKGSCCLFSWGDLFNSIM